MSWNPALDPHRPTGTEIDAIETLIIPRARDIGAFEVRRALPSARRQMVGLFIFFDQMGPVEFLTDRGMDVRLHPRARLMILGGETMGTRHIWWNFVASSRERIEAAKEAWRQADWRGRFRLPPGDDAEFVPLPQPGGRG